MSRPRPLRPPPTPADCPFEYIAFEALFERALRDVADRRVQEMERKAAARAIAFLLREQIVTEAVATDVLVAIWKSLDVSKVTRTLLLALRDVPESHDRMTMWTTRVAERALAEAHVPSFVSALRILVGLRDYDGAMRTSWQVALLRAAELPGRRLRTRVYLLRDEYARRFGDASRWVRIIAVRRLIEAVRDRVRRDNLPSTNGDGT